jgi:hypothetical protein
MICDWWWLMMIDDDWWLMMIDDWWWLMIDADWFSKPKGSRHNRQNRQNRQTLPEGGLRRGHPIPPLTPLLRNPPFATTRDMSDWQALHENLWTEAKKHDGLLIDITSPRKSTPRRTTVNWTKPYAYAHEDNSTPTGDGMTPKGIYPEGVELSSWAYAYGFVQLTVVLRGVDFRGEVMSMSKPSCFFASVQRFSWSACQSDISRVVAKGGLRKRGVNGGIGCPLLNPPSGRVWRFWRFWRLWRDPFGLLNQSASIINHHQSSIIINHQSSSIIINHHQSQIIINH